MVKPSDRTDSLPTDREGYQQALEDFAVTHLLTRLKTYSDADFDTAWMNLTQAELENLAAVLIQGFADTLTGKLLAGYLNAMRHGNADLLPGCAPFSPPSAHLPANFPNIQTPRYLYGDKLRLTCQDDPQLRDRGTVIGRFYSFASHRCGWTWCYLIWLDPDSPSAAWTATDTAWEDNLAPLEEGI